MAILGSIRRVSATSLRLAAPGWFDLKRPGKTARRARQVPGMSTMLVGSHAETGDERKAAAAPLADTIGNNQTAAASAPGARAALPASRGRRSRKPAPRRRGRHAVVAHGTDVFADEGSPGRRPERHVPGRRQHHLQGPRARRIQSSSPRRLSRGTSSLRILDRRSSCVRRGSSVSVNQVHKFSGANGGVAGGPAGGARYRHEEGGVDRVEHHLPPTIAVGAADQFHPE